MHVVGIFLYVSLASQGRVGKFQNFHPLYLIIRMVDVLKSLNARICQAIINHTIGKGISDMMYLTNTRSPRSSIFRKSIGEVINVVWYLW